MNLYLISQNTNNGYDTCDSAVVAAPDPDIAKNMNPYDGMPMDWDEGSEELALSPEDVRVEFIGVAAPGIKLGVICSSYNAG